MKLSDLALLLSLAALWGGSYLFLRMGAGEFGPVALAGCRAAGAALLLLSLLLRRGGVGELRAHWKPIAVVGLAQNALPYLLFSFAALSINAGFSAILTATTPLFAAVVAWRWLGEKLSAPRLAGLAIGLAGVLWLAWDRIGAKTGGAAAGWAVGACLVAAFLYGWAANFAKQRLNRVTPLAVATGSQVTSALVLALPAVVWWPANPPSLRAWGALAALAFACTAVAYVLFFRLIAAVGAARTVTVTFLIPVFGVLWGGLFLGEPFTLAMGLGGTVVLLGTALTTGVIKTRAPWKGTAALASPAPSR